MAISAITMSSASSTNIRILQVANEQFQIAQKRVSTGKWVFGAADDATRYKMSETMLSRSRQIDSVNNNVSLGLKTLEATDKSLKSMIGLAESALDLARKAQAEGAAGVRGITSGANINAATTLNPAPAAASVFSITSDGGQNFTYTFTGVATTWGQVADALNSANIGVQMEFIPSATAGQTNVRFIATNGKDFRFDGVTAQTIMDDLQNASFVSPAGGQTMTSAAQANNLFGAGGGAAPGASETGFTVQFGGSAVGAKNVTSATAVAAGSVLVFEDGNGQTRTLNYTAGVTVDNVITQINSMNAGIVAEYRNNGGGATTQLRLRNSNGGNVTIYTAVGDFAAAGTIGLTPGTFYAAPLSTNNVLRLKYGQQFDNIIANINAQITNNPVQAGRNLLIGQNLAVVMDEFGGTPITVTGSNLTSTGSVNAALGFVAANAGTTWTNDTNIQAAAVASSNSIVILRDLQSQFATFGSYMKARYDLNLEYKNDLKTQGDELVSADMAEESANMTALQTRQQFAVQAFSMGSQTMQGLLRLLG